jgi:hypothetical protein
MGCSVRVRNRIVDGVALHRGGVLHRFIARMAQSSLATLLMPNSLLLVAGLACCRDLIRIKNMELGRGIEIYLSILKTGLIGLMMRRLTIMPASKQILTETD